MSNKDNLKYLFFWLRKHYHIYGANKLIGEYIVGKIPIDSRPKWICYLENVLTGKLLYTFNILHYNRLNDLKNAICPNKLEDRLFIGHGGPELLNNHQFYNLKSGTILVLWRSK